MTEARFDEEIHAPMRLRICALLAPTSSTDFAEVREQLGVADSVVSKHVSRLETAGYVRTSKTSYVGRPRTVIALTPLGRRAFAGHIAALRELAAQAESG